MNQINRSKIIGDISKAPKFGKNRLILFKKDQLIDRLILKLSKQICFVYLKY